MPFAVILFLTGCSSGQTETTALNDTEATFPVASDQTATDAQLDSPAGEMSNQSLVDFGALAVGQSVFVIGEEDSTGSIVATRVIIGGDRTNLPQMDAPATADQPTLPTDFDPSQLPAQENLTGEAAAGGPGGGMRPSDGMTPPGGGQGMGMNNSATTFSGEIIKLTTDSFTISLVDGGSRVILVADSTEIYQVITSTESE